MANPPLRHRLKPRLGARSQYVLAGLVWYAAAVALGVRGVGWVLEDERQLLLVGVGLTLGLLKAQFIMRPVATRAIERIAERDRDKCAGGFFSWRSWVIVIVMMAGGHALRLTSIPHPFLGALYVAIAIGLLVAGTLYWRAAVRGHAAN